jgi:hypothetical protein
MNSQDIDLLVAENGKPCLSIIVPTLKYTRDRMQNPIVVERAISKAQRLLTHNAWPKAQIERMTFNLASLADKLDYIRLQEGLAVFVSPDIFKIYPLPFSVNEKVMLSKNFEIRDLIYATQFLQPYYLITLSRKRIRLFRGSGRDIQEVINEDFPKQYVEEYEYARPCVGSSFGSGLQAFEKDKSILVQTRINAFFKDADKALDKYVKGKGRLFTAGVDEELTEFEQISGHEVTGKIRGNFDVDALHPLAESVWHLMRTNVIAAQEQAVVEFEEALGKSLAVDGIANVWQAAHEGKGRLLLLEKDYQVTGYVQRQHPGHLFTYPPVGQYDLVHDAADDAIEITREKGGEVMIIENGTLEGFDRIAMMLRY